MLAIRYIHWSKTWKHRQTVNGRVAFSIPCDFGNTYWKKKKTFNNNNNNKNNDNWRQVCIRINWPGLFLTNLTILQQHADRSRKHFVKQLATQPRLIKSPISTTSSQQNYMKKKTSEIHVFRTFVQPFTWCMFDAIGHTSIFIVTCDKWLAVWYN